MPLTSSVHSHVAGGHVAAHGVSSGHVSGRRRACERPRRRGAPSARPYQRGSRDAHPDAKPGRGAVLSEDPPARARCRPHAVRRPRRQGQGHAAVLRGSRARARRTSACRCDHRALAMRRVRPLSPRRRRRRSARRQLPGLRRRHDGQRGSLRVQDDTARALYGSTAAPSCSRTPGKRAGAHHAGLHRGRFRAGDPVLGGSPRGTLALLSMALGAGFRAERRTRSRETSTSFLARSLARRARVSRLGGSLSGSSRSTGT